MSLVSERGVASVPFSPCEVGMASVSFRVSERGIAAFKYGHCLFHIQFR